MEPLRWNAVWPLSRIFVHPEHTTHREPAELGVGLGAKVLGGGALDAGTTAGESEQERENSTM